MLLHGRGSTVPLSNNTRMKVSPLKLDHFSTFITSAYVTQDLPFGEKSLKLSSNTETKIPGPRSQSRLSNSTRFTVMRLGLFQWATVHCLGFLKFVRPLCASLPGLNYASAEGAKAFEELADVIDKLGDNHSKGLSWAKDQNENWSWQNAILSVTLS